MLLTICANFTAYTYIMSNHEDFTMPHSINIILYILLSLILLISIFWVHFKLYKFPNFSDSILFCKIIIYVYLYCMVGYYFHIPFTMEFTKSDTQRHNWSATLCHIYMYSNMFYIFHITIIPIFNVYKIACYYSTLTPFLTGPYFL